VSYAADPSNGFFVYTSGAKKAGWYTVGGTSAGAPQWAGLIAVANQGRAEAGKESIADARSAVTMLSDAAFHDVVSGSNGFTATEGTDMATGRGSPNAAITVAQLMGDDMPTQVPFVGPLPEPSNMPKASVQVPTRLDGAFAQIAAAISRQLATNFTIDSLTLRDVQTAQVGGDSGRNELPALAPILVAPTTPLSAVDLSEWGAGDSWEDELVNPPAAPIPDGESGAPAAASATRDQNTAFRMAMTDPRGRVMNVGWNVPFSPRSTLAPDDDPPIVNDRASASPLLLAFLAGGFVLTTERKERQRARRMGN
jgi:hypothetical protein